MSKKSINKFIPEDILYEIFKRFITDKKFANIASVNKEWNVLINKRLMFTHLNEIILNIQKQNHTLKTENNKLNNLYDDLIDTIDEFMNLNHT